jgi:hypothetical protein
MNYLKSLWADRIPSYCNEYSAIFEKLANKGNDGLDNNEKANESGKIFATQYELYIYAFFIGLYSNQQRNSSVKASFGHKISEWGKKNRRSGRESFIEIQDFMFVSIISKSDLNFIELERCSEENEIKKSVTQLLELMETYANGGLQIIKEKLESNENFFISTTDAPLQFLLRSTSNK